MSIRICFINSPDIYVGDEINPDTPGFSPNEYRSRLKPIGVVSSFHDLKVVAIQEVKLK